MKCITCQCERIEARDVVEEIRNGNDIVLISIRIPVCKACGERFYDTRTLGFLREMEKNLTEGSLQLREVGRVLAV
jgi:YgiT-type zinc finger domain-containing protein